MGLLDLFKRVTLSKEKGMLPYENKLSGAKASLTLHPDLEGLIWIADGPGKNYDARKEAVKETSEYWAFVSHSLEPSAISLSLPIRKPTPTEEIPKLPYFPRYAALDETQRWRYLEFLQNPYINIDIGYVFILYYGLERHLLRGNFKKAYDVILKLRRINNNSSFLAYSASALVLSCVKHEEVEYVERFLSTLTESQTKDINISVLLLCFCVFKLPLNAKILMLHAKSFAFENNRYIKSNPELFEAELEETICAKVGVSYILVNNIVKDINKVKSYTFRAFANTSISDEDISIPDLTTDIKLTSLCNGLLVEAHERTKGALKELRKNQRSK